MAENESGTTAELNGLDADTRKWLYQGLLLLPGFLSIGVARYLGGPEDLGDFELTTYSLAASLFIFLVAGLLYGLLRKISRQHRRDPLRLFPSLSSGFALTVLAITLGLGVGLAKTYDSDSGLGVARHLPGMGWLSKRSSSRTLSLFLALNQHENLQEIEGIPTCETTSWAEVAVEGGSRFAGYPRLYSKEKTRTEVFLMPACALQSNNTPTPITGPGILIPEDKILSMTFYDRKDSTCYSLWEKLPTFHGCNKKRVARKR